MPLSCNYLSGSKRAPKQQLQRSASSSNKRQCFWPCPVCNRSFASFLLDDHINQCLLSSSTVSSQSHVKQGNEPAGSNSPPTEPLLRDVNPVLPELVDIKPSATEISSSNDTGDLQVGVSPDGLLCESDKHIGSDLSCVTSAIQLNLEVRVQGELFSADTRLCTNGVGRSGSTTDVSVNGPREIEYMSLKEKSFGNSCESEGAESSDTSKFGRQASSERVMDAESAKLALSVRSLDTISHERASEELLKDGNGRVVERPPPGFKLYQRQKQSQPKLSMFFKRPSSAVLERKASVSVLQPGMILFRNWLDLEKQQLLVQESQNVAHLFHRPITSGGGKYHIYSMCWGPKWNPKTHRYSGSGDEHPLPDWMFDLAQKISSEAQKHTYVYPEGLQFAPDVALVNFYPVKAEELGVIGLGGHQDLDDSCRMPVVSVSVGDSMTFFYRRLPPLSRRKSKIYTSVDEKAAKSCEDGDVAHNREQQLILNSGDVLVFGGESRLIYHGTRHVQADTRPPGLHMVPGRLNFTFRQTDASLNT